VVTFDDQSIRRGVTQSLYFDPVTAAFLESRMTLQGRPDDIQTVASSGIVDSVPAEVRRYADHYTDIGTCVTEHGIQTPDVCSHRYHYDNTDEASVSYVPSTSAAPTSSAPATR